MALSINAKRISSRRKQNVFAVYSLSHYHTDSRFPASVSHPLQITGEVVSPLNQSVQRSAHAHRFLLHSGFSPARGPAGFRIDLPDTILGDLKQVLAVESRSSVRGDIDRAE